MTENGLGGYETLTFLNNMMAQTVVVFTAYFLFGGWRLLGRRHEGDLVVPTTDKSSQQPNTLERKHWCTIVVIGLLLSSVILFNVDVGLGAFACTILLVVLKAGDETQAVSQMPWRVIMMVCGVTVLISVLDETGGLDLFTQLLAGLSTCLLYTSPSPRD